MALALKDRVKETTIVVGTGAATLLGSSIGFQPFSVVGNGNTTYYCISDQFGSNWEVGIGTYSSSGNTLARTTVLASSNGGALVVFTAGVKDVFVTYPAEKGVWLDASGNAIGLGTPAAFVGTNITGTASGLTAGNVTTNANLTGGVTSVGNAATVVTNANLTGAVTSVGNASSLGSFTSLQLATALTDETGSGSAVFATSPTLSNPTYTGTLTGSTGVLNIGSGQVYKDASGNVGIGTTAPNNKLTVGTSNTTVGVGTVASFSGVNVAASNSSGMVVITSTDSIAANIGGSIGFAANGTLAGYPTGSIAGRRENATAGDYSSYMQFTTSGSNGSVQEKMRIDSSGNVGIGTSSPGARLDVRTTLSTQATFTRTGQTAVCTLYQSTADTYLSATNSGANLILATQDTERMRLDSSGNLMVGTTSPTYSSKLSIYAGATTGTTYNVSAATGGSVVTNQQQSTSVSTSAVAILTPNQYASFCVVFGSDGTNRFMDLILCGLGTGTIQVVSSFTVAGSPAARTYTQSSSTYRLAMGSGTYTVKVSTITMDG